MRKLFLLLLFSIVGLTAIAFDRFPIPTARATYIALSSRTKPVPPTPLHRRRNFSR